MHIILSQSIKRLTFGFSEKIFFPKILLYPTVPICLSLCVSLKTALDQGINKVFQIKLLKYFFLASCHFLQKFPERLVPEIDKY